jgi:hypothetical protein
LGPTPAPHDFLKAFRYVLRQGWLKEEIEFIKCISLEPVDPLNFLFADVLERCHCGLLGVLVMRREPVFCESKPP